MTSPMLIDTLKDGNAINATGSLRIMCADLPIFFLASSSFLYQNHANNMHGDRLMYVKSSLIELLFNTKVMIDIHNLNNLKC